MSITKLARARRHAANGTGRAVRMSAAVSLPELASEIGVANSTLWRWENGQRKPRGEAAERYADLIDQLMRDS